MRDGTHGAQKSSVEGTQELGVDSRRALFDRANHLVQRAKHLHQPAAHLGALLESQAGRAHIVAARQRPAHDVAERDIRFLDQVHDGAVEQRQRHAQIMRLECPVAGAAARDVLHPADEFILDQHQRALLEALAQQAPLLVSVGIAVRDIEDHRFDPAGARLADEVAILDQPEELAEHVMRHVDDARLGRARRQRLEQGHLACIATARHDRAAMLLTETDSTSPRTLCWPGGRHVARGTPARSDPGAAPASPSGERTALADELGVSLRTVYATSRR